MSPSHSAGYRAGSRRYGLWRALCALPLALGGLAVVVLLAGGLGRWAGVVPLAWLLLGLMLLTRSGERVGVRVGYGYRAVRAGEWALLEPVWSSVVTRCGLSRSEYDVYVRARAQVINAYAAGRRSIAVSAGLLGALEQKSLTTDQAAAVLVHEVGHLQGRATRYGLATAWLSVPYRALLLTFGGLLRLIVHKVPTAKAALVLVPLLLAVAGVQLVQQHLWAPLAVLAVLAALLTIQPLLDAAMSRAIERDADCYVVDVGSAHDLASVLQSSPHLANSAWGRLQASHPPTEQRIAHLVGAATG